MEPLLLGVVLVVTLLLSSLEDIGEQSEGSWCPVFHIKNMWRTMSNLIEDMIYIKFNINVHLYEIFVYIIIRYKITVCVILNHASYSFQKGLDKYELKKA